MPEPTAPVVLVDGSSCLYRAYHALPALSTHSGQPTGAVRGVIAMLRRLAGDYPDAQMVVVFDAPGPTFRHQLETSYKANRPSMPTELRVQIEPLYQLIEALGWPLLAVPEVEADDVIATLTRTARAGGREVVISSGDKDLAQLVAAGVLLEDSLRRGGGAAVQLDADGVREKFGVPPEHIVDYLALVGDSSDNYAGARGVGAKTARELIARWGGIDTIYEHLDEIASSGMRRADALAKGLSEDRDTVLLARQLATLKSDVSLERDLVALRTVAPDTERLRTLYRELEFRTWLEALDSGNDEMDSAAVNTVPPPDWELVLDEPTLGRWLEAARKAELLSVDLETTSLHYMEAEVVGIALAVQPGAGAYIPIGHRLANTDLLGSASGSSSLAGELDPRQLPAARVWATLGPLLEDAALSKLGQNLKYDRAVLLNHGIQLRGVRHDTMLESYLLRPGGRHDLDSLAARHLQRQMTSYKEVVGHGATQLNFSQVGLEEAAAYAVEDAVAALELHQVLWPELKRAPRLAALYRELDVPLSAILGQMERLGARIDSEQLQALGSELGERAATLEAQAHDMAETRFNLNSPKQLQEVLYERMGLPAGRKTPSGQPSTAEPVLQELAREHKIAKLILDYRSLVKLKSTYADRLPACVNVRSGRVHSSFHQAVTATGRLSSADPNLQNIPIRTAEGRRIRQAFIPAEGYRLLCCDYSQIELRIMAHCSGDRGLSQAFAEGRDIHRATAAELFTDGDEAAVDNQLRRHAKAINFGLIYGMSAYGLARQLDVPQSEARRYMESYFARYPGVQDYMEHTRELARRDGAVHTLYGRRLPVGAIGDRNQARRQAAERAAINAPIQGTAADIVKRAMLAVDRWLAAEQVPARMILQVHDELVLEVETGTEREIGKRISELMVTADGGELDVPLEVDCQYGENWDEAH